MNPPASYSNCLRPSFTEKVNGWLEQGKSVNVFGKEGQGIQRLAEDIAKCCPANIKIVRLSMRSYADSYAGFLQALADALGIEKSADADPRLLLNNFLQNASKVIWLCLEHFDRLTDRPAVGERVDTQGYDIHFLNYLNSLHNNPRISLLVCSNQEVRAQELYIGGKAVSGSRLEFSERVPLSSLTYAEIESYLERRMPDSPQKTALFEQKPTFYNEIIMEIDAHADSALFANFVAEQTLNSAWSRTEFQDRMRFWKKEYNRLHSRTIGRRLSQVEKESRNWLRHAKQMVRIGKIWRAILFTLAILVSMMSGGWRYVEQAIIFLASFFQK